MPRRRRRVLTGLLAITGAATMLPATASAESGVPSTYDHGAYAQVHFSTKAACDLDRSNASDFLNTTNAVHVDPGACHLIDAGVGTTRQTGYVYDMSYVAEKAWFPGDVRLGGYSVPTLTGAHSFKLPGRYVSQSLAQAALDTAVANVASAGDKVTWNSGVAFNAVTKTYDFEVDYDARKPIYWAHTEISESPGVTSPSLGVVTPIPTTPPTDSTDPSTTITPPSTTTTPAGTNALGIDVSSHTTINDWAGWKSLGYSFIIAKASESTNYLSPNYDAQISGAQSNGMYYGAYHFARPSQSTGADQADYFLAHSANLVSGDTKSLGRWLDIEDNPSSTGGMCYGMTQSQMDTWVNDFRTELKVKTGQNVGIYTRAGWWNTCVGVSTKNANAPLWEANWNTSVGTLPTTWRAAGQSQLIWQNSADDAKGYDTDVFNGDTNALKAYAASSKS